MPDAQVPAQNPAPVPNPQVVQPTTSSGISWKKILLTVLVAMVVVGLIAGALWYFVLGKSDTDTLEELSPAGKKGKWAPVRRYIESLAARSDSPENQKIVAQLVESYKKP